MSQNYSLAVEASASSKRRIALIGAFLMVSTVALLYSRSEPASALPIQASKPAIPNLGPIASPRVDIGQNVVTAALTIPEANDWTKIIVAPRQNLSNIFESQGLPADNWMQITRLGGDSTRLQRIRAGDQLNLKITSGQLAELSYAYDETHTLSIRRKGAGFEAATITATLERRNNESAGVIRSSLFADGHKAGLSDRMILEFADIFGYDIDFAQDLQEGDHFAVIFDQLYKEGKKIREGDILAAEFVNQGHVYRAVRYVDSEGRSSYYTPDGQSLRRAFIRTPVDFARISSGFNLHRFHPILNVIRAHKGVDYAAAIGTPVHATGDGKVEFVGVKGGYGNVLIIQHGSQYETVYGHLSRFQTGLRVGARVRQGQTVAYVGRTGLATAPHLHYEFRVNGVHQNPVTVPLPRSIPLNPQLVAQFRAQARPLVAKIEALNNRRFASLSR